jgi:hypothetical protein
MARSLASLTTNKTMSLISLFLLTSASTSDGASSTSQPPLLPPSFTLPHRRPARKGVPKTKRAFLTQGSPCKCCKTNAIQLQENLKLTKQPSKSNLRKHSNRKENPTFKHPCPLSSISTHNRRFPSMYPYIYIYPYTYPYFHLYIYY